jgi:23S rRNA (uridine2552-2'-O)-methyltransferase
MAERLLKPHGHALIKVFQGAGFQAPAQAARGRFAGVNPRKAGPSRAWSTEMYLLAMVFRLV